MTVVSYINRQGGLSSRRLFTLAERLLRWAQLNLRLLRAAHLPGKPEFESTLPCQDVENLYWALRPL